MGDAAMTPELLDRARALAHTHEQAEARDPIKARGRRHRNIHTTLRELIAALAAEHDARVAAEAGVERLKWAALTVKWLHERGLDEHSTEAWDELDAALAAAQEVKP